MEHADALARIEIAAAEPDGLDRLMAGDTADAAAVAGHLAGCASCTAELVRVRRVAAVAREVIRTSPDPALRAKTLAYVKAAGVSRGTPVDAAVPAAEASTGAAVAALAGPAPAPAAAEAPARVVPIDGARERRAVNRLRLAVAGLAAALVIAAGGGLIAYRAATTAADETIALKTGEIAILEETNRATLRVTAAPDARRVELASADGSGATGTLLFSPSTGELVAVAADLVPEAADQEYGCWVEVDGTRTRLGKMYWAGDLWTWAGPVDGLAEIPAGATFGVSLGPIGGGADSTPVLTGSL